ncbi:hypothetical protein, partial [Photobacterium leiognathi]
FKYFTYLIFLSFLIFSNPKIIYSLYEKYSNLLFYITIFSFFSYVLNFLNITSSTLLISSGNREYFSSFFNILMSDSKVSYMGYQIYRFQSIFEEPGTYSFLLLPVIFWYQYVDIKRFRFYLLVAALIFTMSIGSILVLALVYVLISLLNRKSYKYLTYIVAISIALFLIIYSNDFLSDYIANKFGFGAYANTHTSLGVREKEVFYLLNLLKDQFLGVGFSTAGLGVISGGAYISIGLFRLFCYSGFFGMIFLVCLFAYLITYSIYLFNKRDNIIKFSAAVLFSMLAMSLQRSSFIDGYMFVLLFASVFPMLKYRFYNESI